MIMMIKNYICKIGTYLKKCWWCWSANETNLKFEQGRSYNPFENISSNKHWRKLFRKFRFPHKSQSYRMCLNFLATFYHVLNWVTLSPFNQRSMYYCLRDPYDRHPFLTHSIFQRSTRGTPQIRVDQLLWHPCLVWKVWRRYRMAISGVMLKRNVLLISISIPTNWIELIPNNLVTVVTSLDIQGAFNNAIPSSLHKVAINRRIEGIICDWNSYATRQNNNDITTEGKSQIQGGTDMSSRWSSFSPAVGAPNRRRTDYAITIRCRTVLIRW